MHEFIDTAHAAIHVAWSDGHAMARPWLLMTTSLTYAYPMTTQGAGILDMINSKQYASGGPVHTCAASIHSYAVRDGLDVASYVWLHIA